MRVNNHLVFWMLAVLLISQFATLPAAYADRSKLRPDRRRPLRRDRHPCRVARQAQHDRRHIADGRQPPRRRGGPSPRPRRVAARMERTRKELIELGKIGESKLLT